MIKYSLQKKRKRKLTKIKLLEAIIKIKSNREE